MIFAILFAITAWFVANTRSDPVIYDFLKNPRGARCNDGDVVCFCEKYKNATVKLVDFDRDFEKNISADQSAIDTDFFEDRFSDDEIHCPTSFGKVKSNGWWINNREYLTTTVKKFDELWEKKNTTICDYGFKDGPWPHDQMYPFLETAHHDLFTGWMMNQRKMSFFDLWSFVARLFEINFLNRLVAFHRTFVCDSKIIVNETSQFYDTYKTQMETTNRGVKLAIEIIKEKMEI